MSSVAFGWHRTAPSLRIVIKRLQMNIHFVVLFMNFRIISDIIYYEGLLSDRSIGSGTMAVVIAASSQILPSSLRYDFVFTSQTIYRATPVNVLFPYLNTVSIRV